MNQTTVQDLDLASMKGALEKVSKVIPPLFPLRHFVAVNPYMGYSTTEYTDAAREIALSHGSLLAMPPGHYAAKFSQGEITRDDLGIALKRCGCEDDISALISWAGAGGRQATPPLPTFAGFLDTEEADSAWEHWVSCQIGQFCAAYYDVNQATWPMPWRHLPLLAAWKEYAAHDASPEAAGVTGFRSLAMALPDDPIEAVHQLVSDLKPAGVPLALFLVREVASVAGWAGHVQFRVREHALRGRADNSLTQFVVIRLAYDLALLRSRGSEALRDRWHELKPKLHLREEDFRMGMVWQAAAEIGYQRRLLGVLSGPTWVRPLQKPVFQAVFCIDVRSERLRRHLEQIEPSIQTIGFAGFFGMPVAYSDPGTGETTARVPALFAPKLQTSLAPEAGARLARRREITRAWHGFQHAAASCFSYVEAFGLGALASAVTPRAKPLCKSPSPSWHRVPFEERLALAENFLRGTGLDRDLAPLVLICGHGSANVNNPQASALECGACGGHAGDHNARLAAALLNDPSIRCALEQRGIAIPPGTVFLAGIHNTTTDEVEWIDRPALSPSSGRLLDSAKGWFREAAARSREERDTGLNRDGAWSKRARDMSETRPEFGLAGNAAILLAPRALSRGKDLHARVFLHDYDASRDASLNQLVFLLSAPVVVASWINLQYFASRISPDTFGAGNKVLHNVAGGVGVIEGNAGDLRPGLAWQSLHDGERFVHEPLKLSVVASASRTALDAALARAEEAQALVMNGWIHLIAVDDGVSYLKCRDGSWLPLQPQEAA
ncbi:MAG: DUF2309 domain-containing protein [Opitutaceae bacterium]|nr:DUF2309 domain-containing protein [Opitutaceae bacterium]